MWFKYLWMVVLAIWIIIANVVLIKEFIKAKFSIHQFEENFDEDNQLIIGAILTDIFIAIFTAIILIVYKLWIPVAVVWGLIGLYPAKEFFIDKREWDFIYKDRDTMSCFSMGWCIISLIAGVIVVIASIAVYIYGTIH